MALLGGAPRVVNVGLDLFALALTRRDVAVVHVDWRDPLVFCAERFVSS